MSPRSAAFTWAVLTRNLTRALAIASVLALVVTAALWYAFVRPAGRTVTAYFDLAVGVYPGSDVRVLGVQVGAIDEVTPVGREVRVVMHVDPDVDVPADAKAAVVAPSLVSDRYVQLAPAYTGGAKLASGAVLGRDRTAVPVELDQVFGSLDTLSKALGPHGANNAGALSDLIDVSAQNLAGNGAALNTTVTNLSQAIGTLSDSRTQLFGTVDNLARFTSTLAASDGQVRQINSQLRDVAGFLAAERTNLSGTLQQLSVALSQVATFVRDNRELLRTDVGKLTSLTDILVKERGALAEVLDVAPDALNNLANAYNASSGTLDNRTNFNELANPGLLVCKVLAGPDGAAIKPPPEVVAACAQLAASLGGQLPVLNPAQILAQLQSGQTPVIPGVSTVPSLPAAHRAGGGR